MAAAANPHMKMLGTKATVHTSTGIEVSGTIVSYADGWIVVDSVDGLWHFNPDQVIAVEALGPEATL